MAGDFIWSLTYTDILSGWTEGGAVWNKGAVSVSQRVRAGKKICTEVNEVNKEGKFWLLTSGFRLGARILRRSGWI